jgi:hypothetical protein
MDQPATYRSTAIPRQLVSRAGVLAIILLLLASGLGSPAEATEPIKFSDTFSFSGLDEPASDECGFPVNLEIEGRFLVIIRETMDGEQLVTDHSTFHATYTNVETGESVTSNGGSTAHVVVGAGTDGRDVVKITGLQGHVVAPGSGSAAQDSGQLVIEAYGPGDPSPLFVSERGLFEGGGGPFPELCEALS